MSATVTATALSVTTSRSAIVHRWRSIILLAVVATVAASPLQALLNLVLGLQPEIIAILCRGRLAAVDEPGKVLTAGLLSDVYGCPIAVGAHPVRGCPLVMPLPTSAATERQPRSPRAVARTNEP